MIWLDWVPCLSATVIEREREGRENGSGYCLYSNA